MENIYIKSKIFIFRRRHYVPSKRNIYIPTNANIFIHKKTNIYISIETNIYISIKRNIYIYKKDNAYFNDNGIECLITDILKRDESRYTKICKA